MAGILDLISFVPTLMSAFSGDTSAPYRKQQEEQARRMSEYSAALADTDNPLYKKLYGQYRQQNQQSIAEVIAEAQRQNRMAQRLGRAPLFSQDRGSENIFRAMIQQQQQAGAQADQQTRDSLKNALAGSGATSQVYARELSPYTALANKQRLGGFYNIADYLNGNQSIFNNDQQSTINDKRRYNPISGGYY